MTVGARIWGGSRSLPHIDLLVPQDRFAEISSLGHREKPLRVHEAEYELLRERSKPETIIQLSI